MGHLLLDCNDSASIASHSLIGVDRLSTDDTKKGIIANALAAINANQQPSGTQSLGLASLWIRPEVRGLYYSGKVLKLDGYRFVECRFDNCILEVNSENFELVQCVLDASTRIQYSTNVTKLIKLFLGRYHWAAQYFPAYFIPTKNPDGSETISDQGQ